MEGFLKEILPSNQEFPNELHEAMRYAVLGGGKRVRAALVLATGLAVHRNELNSSLLKALQYAAAAVELIHAYSLVHDDMPCMDDDKLRRGKPTVHVKYGEAQALLVGDALQTSAFEQLVKMPVAPALVVQAVRLLATASGSMGMAGGQSLDLKYVNQSLELEQLQQMHRLKTGALIEGSVMLGAVACGANYEDRQALETFGSVLGLAYQVVDDVLDQVQDTEKLGKTAGKDAQHNKPNYVSVMGLEQAQNFAKELHELALDTIIHFGPRANRLRGIAEFVLKRSN
nr:farnesyl diphosphate synthase [Brackiella oedipodis]